MKDRKETKAFLSLLPKISFLKNRKMPKGVIQKYFLKQNRHEPT